MTAAPNDRSVQDLVRIVCGFGRCQQAADSIVFLNEGDDRPGGGCVHRCLGHPACGTHLIGLRERSRIAAERSVTVDDIAKVAAEVDTRVKADFARVTS